MPPERDPPEREPDEREPPERDAVERDPPERDEVDREELERVELERDEPEPLALARVVAAFFAAVLRLAAARLRVAAAFFAAAARDFDVEPPPPRALFSIWSASPRSSSTVLRTSFPELSPASAIARAARFRNPLLRSLLNRSLSSVALAIVSSCLATGRLGVLPGTRFPCASHALSTRFSRSVDYAATSRSCGRDLRGSISNHTWVDPS